MISDPKNWSEELVRIDRVVHVVALVLGKVSVSGYSDLAVSLSYSVDVGRSFAQKFLSKSAF